MNDTSGTGNNQTQRKTFGKKGKSWNWIAYLAMLMLFGFTVIGMLWFIFVEGYEMRGQDWFWFGFNVLATIVGAGALWEEWRKRRASDKLPS